MSYDTEDSLPSTIQVLENMFDQRLYEQIAKMGHPVIIGTDEKTQRNFCIGMALRKDGDINQALQYFDKACETDTQKPQIHKTVYRYLKKEELWSEALRHLDRAIEKFPSDEWFENRKGLLLAKFGEYDAAKDALNKAARKNPSEAMGAINLAFLAMWTGDWKEAEWFLKRIDGLDIRKTEQFYVNKGLYKIFNHWGYVQDATSHLEKMIYAFPELKDNAEISSDLSALQKKLEYVDNFPALNP